MFFFIEESMYVKSGKANTDFVDESDVRFMRTLCFNDDLSVTKFKGEVWNFFAMFVETLQLIQSIGVLNFRYNSGSIRLDQISCVEHV